MILGRPISSFLAVFRRDAQADRIVPRSGFTAQLTLFTAGAMAFLAVFALALSLSAGRLAERWGAELARGLTVRIVAPPEQQTVQVQASLRVLETTSGVMSARALSDAEQRALLAPWLGADLPLDQLPVPRLIDVQEAAQRIDVDGLRLRLRAEAPGAVVDDHTRWRAPLVQAARGLRLLGWVSMGLIAAATAAMITLAAQAALAANAQVVSVLRLVGATDLYIANAFVRRFTLRAGLGALVGVLVGLVVLFVLPSAGDSAGILTGLGLRGVSWALPLLVPPFVALVAFFATRAAAARVLEGVT